MYWCWGSIKRKMGIIKNYIWFYSRYSKTNYCYHIYQLATAKSNHIVQTKDWINVNFQNVMNIKFEYIVWVYWKTLKDQLNTNVNNYSLFTPVFGVQCSGVFVNIVHILKYIEIHTGEWWTVWAAYVYAYTRVLWMHR